MNPYGIIVILIGGFCLAAAVADWDWFMNHYKARFFVKILGRTGARVFYGILGAALSIIGILSTFGAISLD